MRCVAQSTSTPEEGGTAPADARIDLIDVVRALPRVVVKALPRVRGRVGWGRPFDAMSLGLVAKAHAPPDAFGVDLRPQAGEVLRDRPLPANGAVLSGRPPAANWGWCRAIDPLLRTGAVLRGRPPATNGGGVARSSSCCERGEVLRDRSPPAKSEGLRSQTRIDPIDVVKALPRVVVKALPRVRGRVGWGRSGPFDACVERNRWIAIISLFEMTMPTYSACRSATAKRARCKPIPHPICRQCCRPRG